MTDDIEAILEAIERAFDRYAENLSPEHFRTERIRDTSEFGLIHDPDIATFRYLKAIIVSRVEEREVDAKGPLTISTAMEERGGEVLLIINGPTQYFKEPVAAPIREIDNIEETIYDKIWETVPTSFYEVKD